MSTKPRALNTFLDGLAELGVDKGLIKNKKLLSDLIEKEKASEMQKILPIMIRMVHWILKLGGEGGGGGGGGSGF